MVESSRLFIRPKPKFPIEPGRNRFSCKIIWFRRRTNIYNYVLDIADITIAHQFNRLAEFGPAALHAACLENPVILPRGDNHSTAFFNGKRQGLFAVNILSCLGCQYGYGGVPMVGDCYSHCLNVFSIQYLPEITIGIATGKVFSKAFYF